MGNIPTSTSSTITRLENIYCTKALNIGLSMVDIEYFVLEIGLFCSKQLLVFIVIIGHWNNTLAKYFI